MATSKIQYPRSTYYNNSDQGVPATIHIESGMKALLVIIGSIEANCYIGSVYCDSQGVVFIVPVTQQGSNLTITTDINLITVTNSSTIRTAAVYLIKLA